MNQTELESRLAALDARLGKAADEIQAEVQNLKDELAQSGGTTPAVDAIVARLDAKAQALDDRNPDAPTTSEDQGTNPGEPTQPTVPGPNESPDSAVV